MNGDDWTFHVTEWAIGNWEYLATYVMVFAFVVWAVSR